MGMPKEVFNIYAVVGMYNKEMTEEELFEHIVDVVINKYKNIYISKFRRIEPLTRELILSKSRESGLIYVRQLICYYLCSKKVILKTIGRLMGGQDHTTIINARDSFKNRLDTLAPLPGTIESNSINTYEDYRYFKRLV